MKWFEPKAFLVLASGPVAFKFLTEDRRVIEAENAAAKTKKD